MSVLKNQIRFDYQTYGEDAIILESQIEFIKLGSWQHRTEYLISMSELSLQDLSVNFDELTELQDSSVFKLQRGSLVPNKNESNLVQGNVIMINMDLTVI